MKKSTTLKTPKTTGEWLVHHKNQKKQKNIPPEIKIDSIEIAPAKDKFRRYIYFYLIFLESSCTGRSNSSRQEVLQPTISNDMVEAYALSKVDMAQHVRHNLNCFADKNEE